MKAKSRPKMSKYKYITKHFVSLTWFDQDVRKCEDEPWRYFAVSCFVMSFNEQWYLATAGHIMQALATNRERGLTRVRSMGLVDHGGVEAKFLGSYPFEYWDAEQFFIVDEKKGLDFGFVKIIPFYRRILEANSVTAIDENHWDRDNEFDAEEHIIIGCPRKQQIMLGGIQNGESTLEGHARIVVMPIEIVPDENRSTLFPRFCGRPRDPKVVSLDEVDGFSGGSVFALGEPTTEGKVPYRAIGMQHSWQQSSGLIWASPLKVIGMLFRKQLACESID